MEPIGLLVALLGFAFTAWTIHEWRRAARARSVPVVSTGEAARNGRGVAAPNGTLSAHGFVSCASPLISPMTGTPCLYFHLEVKETWKEGVADKSRLVEEAKGAARFTIDDGTGQVLVDASEGGEFQSEQETVETKAASPVDAIIGAELVFGRYRLRTTSLSASSRFTVRETVLPVVPRVFATGRVAERGGAIAAPSVRRMMASP